MTETPASRLKELIPLHSLRIENLRLDVHLGCTAEERAVPQEVRVTVEFRFHEPPAGLLTDELRDTICYAEVSQWIGEVARARHYQLVEKLAGDIYLKVSERTRGLAACAMSIHKVKPPVDNLLGGTVYRLGEFIL